MEADRNMKKLAVVSSQYSQEKDYWLAKLSGELIKSSFPYDHKSKPGQRRVETVETGYTGRLFNLLMKLSSGSDSRLHMILVAAVSALLYKYTGSSDIILGSPTLKQDLDVRFINTVLVLRNAVRDNMTFKELLLQVRQSVVEATENQNYPMERLLFHLNIPVSGGDFPLFDIAVLLENIHTVKYIEHVRPNLLFTFKAAGDCVDLVVEYNAGLYEKASVGRILSHLERLLWEVLEKIDIQVSAVNILSGEEKEKLIYRFNDTEAGYPVDMTVQRLFESKAAKVPGNIALAGADGTSMLTYGELNRKADQLAGTLRKKGVKANSIVAVILDRVLEMPVAILGILKAGGAYLPIDPDYPQKRIDYMLKDSNAALLLTACELVDICRGTACRASIRQGTACCAPTNLAYIIYTSGTTGKPRGVMLEHKNVVRLMFNDRNPFDFTEEDVWTLFHSYCFDFSVWEMYGALLYGGKLIIIPRMVAIDSPVFLDVLKKNKVTVLNQTPTAFYNLIEEELKSRKKELNLRYIIFGGEALAPAKLENWKRKYPGVKLINMYGITETTVHVTFKEIEAEDIERNSGNIGKPLPTLNTYVMDRNRSLLPIGIPGELFAAGPGLGRGYMNLVELTTEKFVENIYKPGERLYRSGDLVRLRENGEMEYLGRIDQQVKIRGYRIELREIENQLLNHEEIKEAAVIFREGNAGDKNLYAYFVSEKEPGTAELRDFLGKILPDYMIPLSFVQVEEIPLTPNGKLDKNALPLPELKGAADCAAPRNALEEKLVEIWKRVLGAEQLGIKDNYFNVGGDSIRAIKLLNSINTQLNTQLRIPDLYLNETVEKLAVIIDQEKPVEKDEETKIALQEIEELKNSIMGKIGAGNDNGIEDIYPMSDIEKGMVYHSLKNPGAAQYHDQLVYQVKYRDFKGEIFKKAFTLLVEKHSILRTAFHMDDFEEPVQIVYKKVFIDIEHYDIANLEKQEQEIRIKNFILEDRQKVFDVITPPLWRMRVFSLGSDNIAVVWIFHHAIIDGWSNASLMTELNNTYLELKNNREFIPGKLKCGYKDFVVEQAVIKKKVEIIDYWKKELEDYKRIDFLRGIEPSVFQGYHDKKEFTYNLGLPFLEKLEGAAKKYNISVKHLCIGAYAYMLNMLSYENDIVVGLVTNNRPLCEDGDKAVGCFLNSVPLRLKITTGITWSGYFHMVNEKLSELKMYDRMPLAEIVNIIGEKALDRNAIFDILFNYVDFYIYGQANQDNIPGSSDDVNNQLLIEPYENTNTLFDLSINTTLRSFSLHFSYSAVLFEDDFVENLCRYFINVLNKSIDDPGEYAEKDAILTEKEKRCLLYEFNDTGTDYPGDKTLHELFEEQTERIPGKTAVVFEDERLTYGELNKKANRLAGLLRTWGVGPDQIVGLMVDRSLEMIVGILGILKAGGAYLPIGLDYPRERIEYMLADSNAALLLTSKELSDVGRGTKFCAPTTCNLHLSLAYVIYTSGTTGRPNGTPVEQRSLVNLCWWHNNYYRVSEQDNATQYANISFDASVWEIFPYLIKGAALHIISEDIKLDMQGLSDYYTKHHITISFLPTQLCRQFMEEAGELPSLRCLLTGGDRLNRFVEAGYRLYNNYGPTENTVVTTSCPVEAYKENIPIGKPIDNNRVYILNKDNLQLQPFGVAGELCIAGDSLARGYLNRPELTAEKFFNYRSYRSYSLYSSKKLYRTGDLARWLEDGNMEFIGRVDQQVKIRGFRIEPGEIENRLLSHEDINEAIVVSKQDNRGTYRNLCAYFVAGAGLSAADLRRHLSQELPGYMIPSYFIRVEEMPLTPNGKVDLKALPDPLETGERRYTSPRDDMEEKLVEIWSEVLGVPTGIDDNFFELGGHSLRAVFLLSRIHRELNVKIPLEAIFKNPTIEELANYLKASGFDRFVTIAPAEEMDYYPVSPAQKRLFILQHMEKENLSYNVPRFLVLVGKFDGGSLEQALVGLINRHENLRTSFEMLGEEPIQRVHRDTDFAVEYYEMSEDGARELAYNFIKPFDLGRFPLLRVRLVKTGETRYILMWDMHHIITDGTSMGIFLKEFSALYTGEKLPPLRIQYKDFSRWQNFSTRIEAMNNQEEYWLKEFEGDVPALNLPLDYERPELQTSEGKRLAFEIDTEKTKMLKQMALEEGATLYMVLLAMYNVLLSRLCDQEDIVVGSPIAGRRHADLEMLIGFFVNMLALRNFPTGRKTFRQFLLEVKDRTLKAYENQDYQFEELVDKVLKQRESSRHSLIDVVFAFQNLVLPGDQITEVNIPGITLKPYDHYGEISPFDLGLEGSDAGEKLFFLLHYRTKLFKEETVQKIAQTFKEIVATVSDNKNLRLSDINISHNLLSVEPSSLREEDGDFEF